MAFYHSSLGITQVCLTTAPPDCLGRKPLAGRLLRAWWRHRRNRRELLQLDHVQLKDAGISREALRKAIDTPFWRL